MESNRNPFFMKFEPFRHAKIITYSSSLRIPKNFLRNEITLLRFIMYRRKLNMNTILLVVGNVRTGKSYLALKIAEEYCRLNKTHFNVRKQCSFEIIPFLRWSQNAVDSVFVLDEVGVTLNSQDWFTIQSKIMRNFIQAQGFRRNLLIIVLPSIAFLLKSIRFMVNYVVETIQQGTIKWYKMVMRHSLGKGHISYMGILRFGLPSKETVEEYENMKKEWNDEQLDTDIEQLEGMKELRFYTMPKQDLVKAVKGGLIDDDKFVDDLTSKGYRKTDAKIMLELAKGSNSKSYNHVCASCGGSWESHVKSPKKCPNCQSYNWDKEKIIDPV